MGDAAINLDVRAQNTQMRVGVVVIAIALTLAVTLLGDGVSPSYRALLGLPFFVGTYGVYAGLTKVCGFTALRGKRITESGTMPVADKDELAKNRRQGIRVLAGSACIAAAATLLLVIAR